MNEKLKDIDTLLAHLLISLQTSAIQHMGKVISPLTGKVERDLKSAKFNIDLIEMMEKKMKGNLTDDETKLFGHILYELRLNYVDEVKKSDSPETPPEADDKQEETNKETNDNSDENKSNDSKTSDS